MSSQAAYGCPMGDGPHCRVSYRGGAGGSANGRERAGEDHGVQHGHAHDHHDHDHRHDFREAGKKGLTIVLFITSTFMIVEFVGGWLSNSLALMADAGHMLTDAGAIGLSLFALWFAQRPATPEKTYGYLRWEILAALINGATLIVLAGLIFFEAYRRFRAPAEIEGGLMLLVAVGGLLVNVAAAFILHRSAGHSLNVRGAYLHVLGDLLGSVGAIAAALVILGTGWTYADPLISIFVGLLILVSSWRLVRESVDVLLESVPPHIDLGEVRSAINEISGVDEVHDLHVWTLTSGYFAMSGHAVVADPGEHQRVLEEIHACMAERFGIRHITVQLERESLHPGEPEHI